MNGLPAYKTVEEETRRQLVAATTDEVLPLLDALLVDLSVTPVGSRVGAAVRGLRHVGRRLPANALVGPNVVLGPPGVPPVPREDGTAKDPPPPLLSARRVAAEAHPRVLSRPVLLPSGRGVVEVALAHLGVTALLIPEPLLEVADRDEAVPVTE